jgi:hypothetical protein
VPLAHNSVALKDVCFVPISEQAFFTKSARRKTTHFLRFPQHFAGPAIFPAIFPRRFRNFAGHIFSPSFAKTDAREAIKLRETT